jgi:hypothetical protein
MESSVWFVNSNSVEYANNRMYIQEMSALQEIRMLITALTQPPSFLNLCQMSIVNTTSTFTSILNFRLHTYFPTDAFPSQVQNFCVHFPSIPCSVFAYVPRVFSRGHSRDEAITCAFISSSLIR